MIPTYNEPGIVNETVRIAADEAARSGFRDPEIVVVDDGSDAATASALDDLSALVPVRVLHQENRGRFEARRTGLQAAQGDYVLLLDSRVTLHEGALSFVASEMGPGKRVWNGHCIVSVGNNPFAAFWDVLTQLAFADYFEAPRTTSFGLPEYDRFPKGTGHFLAPRAWLLEAIDGFSSHYRDTRFASDDTGLLRGIAERERINISPSFSSTYVGRDSLRPFLRHALHRGTTFFDGFARRGTRFFPVVVASFPLSLAGLALLLRRPRDATRATFAMILIAYWLPRRRVASRRSHAAAFAGLLPLFAAAYALGIWRGAVMAVREAVGR